MNFQTINELVQRGDVNTARMHLTKYIQDHPDNLEAKELALTVFDISNLTEPCEKIAASILTDHPNHYLAICTQAKALLTKKKFKLALKKLALAIKLEPKKGYAYSIRGNFHHYHSKHFYSALKDYEHVFKDDELGDPLKKLVLNETYDCQLNIGNFEGAKSAMKIAQIIDKQSPIPAIRLAFLESLESASPQLQTLEDMVKQHPEEDEGYRLLAVLHQSLGDLNTAKTIYNTRLESAQDPAMFYYHLASIEFAQNNRQASMDAISKAIERSPFRTDFESFRANIWLVNAQYSEFLTEITAIINRVGITDEISFLYADYYCRIKDFKHAILYLNKINMKETINPLITPMKILCLAKLGRTKDCHTLLNSHTSTTPPSAQFLPFIFSAYLELNDTQKANDYLLQISETDLPIAMIYSMFSMIHLKEKDYENAYKRINQAIETDNSTENRLLKLDIVYHLSNKSEYETLLKQLKKESEHNTLLTTELKKLIKSHT